MRSKKTRLELAARRKLLETVFQGFCNTCYDDLPPHQEKALREAFMAGAAEVISLLNMEYGADDEIVFVVESTREELLEFIKEEKP